MTEAEVRRIVADMFGVDVDGTMIGSCSARGNVSRKMLGDLVAESGERNPFVVVDLRGVTRIAGRRPWWRGMPHIVKNRETRPATCGEYWGGITGACKLPPGHREACSDNPEEPTP